MTVFVLAFGPQYLSLRTRTSLSPIFHDWSLYGPVPTGFCVANVPLGRNWPSAPTVPASALYFFSAVGLAIPKFASASAPRNDVERRERMIRTEYGPAVLHP